MADEDKNTNLTVVSYVMVFSFFSEIFIFIAMLLIGSINNYVLNQLLSTISLMAGAGSIPSSFSVTAIASAETFIDIIPYIDYIWFSSFITMVATSLIISYFKKRENYFNLLVNSVFGLIIFTYVGGILIQFTEWFNIEILLKVFPSLNEQMPLFSWYLNNMGVINLILFSLIIILNFVDLDLSKFNRRKDNELINEI